MTRLNSARLYLALFSVLIFVNCTPQRPSLTVITKTEEDRPATEAIGPFGPRDPGIDSGFGTSPDHASGDSSTPGPPSRPKVIKNKPVASLSSADTSSWLRSMKSEPYFIYARIPERFQKNDYLADIARVGLAKVLNSVSAAKNVYIPKDVSDGHGILFEIDMRELWQDSYSQKWAAFGQLNPAFKGQDPRGVDSRHLARLDRTQPIDADRLIYNMLHPDHYYVLIDAPKDRDEFRQKYGVTTAKRTAVIGVNRAITHDPRYAQRYQLDDGRAYWESWDTFTPNSQRTMDEIIFKRGTHIPEFSYGGDDIPLDMNVYNMPDASEAWYHLPNGMIAYILWNGFRELRAYALRNVVVNPLHKEESRDKGLLRGGECIYCHVNGVQHAQSDMAKYIANGEITSARAKEFWTDKDSLNEQYAKDQKLYSDAMTEIIYGTINSHSAYASQFINGRLPNEPAYILRCNLNASGCADIIDKAEAEGEAVFRDQNKSNETSSGETPEKLSFADDILPILTSQASGRNYQCTRCHSEMAQERTFENAAKRRQVLSRLRSSTNPMPPRLNTNYDTVSPDDLDKLERFFRQF